MKTLKFTLVLLIGLIGFTGTTKTYAENHLDRTEKIFASTVEKFTDNYKPSFEYDFSMPTFANLQSDPAETDGGGEQPPLLDQEGMDAIADALTSGTPVWKLWYFWVGLVVIIWEIVARAVPSVSNWTFTGTLSGLLDAVLANRATGGGKHKSKVER